MPDRIAKLEVAAERLARELSDLRDAISELRAARGNPEPSEVRSSRIGVFNAALLAQAADPGPGTATEPTTHASAGTLPAQPGAATTWDGVFRTLGLNQVGAAASGESPFGGRRARAWVDRVALEDLVGRYGTIALASLTILLGIGAFIGWALRNGYIGPAARVGTGLVIAAVLALAGWRVRRGDSPRYGNALLALSLAVVHVVAWGAGPRLHLISMPAVLTLAALSSGALAALAWHEDDQTLFNVGFGGALLAPFVTSEGGGHAVMLLSYGFVVLAAGIASLGQRTWTRTPFVASIGIVVYAATGANLAQGNELWAVRSSAGAFAVGLSALASVLLDGAKRMAVTYPALVTAFGAMLAVADGATTNAAQFPFAIALAIATRFGGDVVHRGLRTAVIGGFLLPFGATALALGSLDRVTSPAGAGTALLFAGVCALWAWQDATGDRRTHAFAATALAGLAVALGSADRQLLFCLLISAFGLSCAVATQRLRLGGIGVAGALWLAAGTAAAFQLLGRRVAYEYTPFLTEASLAAAAVSVAWVVLSFHTARNLAERSRLSRDLPRSVIRMLGGAVAFFWIREELAHAVSPDVSAFLVIAWYAVSGVAAIFLGHARGLPVLRQLGLALSVFAALTAMAQATSLAIGWRVGSYLLAGVFLLGVAYSYRVTRATPPAAEMRA